MFSKKTCFLFLNVLIDVNALITTSITKTNFNIISLQAIVKQQLGEFDRLFEHVDDPVGIRRIRNKRRIGLLNFVTEDSTESSIDQKFTGNSRYVDYKTGWKLQQDLVADQLERLTTASKNDCEHSECNEIAMGLNQEWCQWQTSVNTQLGRDCVILLEHTPVYTLGTGSDEKFILAKEDRGDVEVIRIERGGEVTYHGPGQLVVYPILDLRGYKKDIHWYMRALEEAILQALASVGVKDATREEDVTGVWIKGKKVAALGVKARRWVTMHGLAVNVEHRSLENFNGIVPCGLEGRAVTCINDVLSTPISVSEFSGHMKRAIEDVFCVTLVEHSSI